jgi:hypothetical protein
LQMGHEAGAAKPGDVGAPGNVGRFETFRHRKVIADAGGVAFE